MKYSSVAKKRITCLDRQYFEPISDKSRYASLGNSVVNARPSGNPAGKSSNRCPLDGDSHRERMIRDDKFKKMLRLYRQSISLLPITILFSPVGEQSRLHQWMLGFWPHATHLWLPLISLMKSSKFVAMWFSWRFSSFSTSRDCGANSAQWNTIYWDMKANAVNFVVFICFGLG